MRKRLPAAVTGVAITLGMLHGDSLALQRQASTPGTFSIASLEASQTLTTEQTNLVRNTFVASEAYWQKEHPGIVAAKLILLQGREEFTCTNIDPSGTRVSSILTSLSPPQYCPVQRGVVITAAYVRDEEAVAMGGGGDPAVMFTDAHEVGHDVEVGQGMYFKLYNEDVQGSNPELELRADCYAGRELASFIGHATLNTIANQLRTLEGDTAHGSGTQTADAFLQGAHGASC